MHKVEKKLVTWNDIQTGTPAELKRKYKLDDRGFEMQFRSHLDGAGEKERRKEYHKLYERRC